jgi:hypothetical protein
MKREDLPTKNLSTEQEEIAKNILIGFAAAHYKQNYQNCLERSCDLCSAYELAYRDALLWRSSNENTDAPKRDT